jgi:ACS family hexuronate transporter-like MFS transporter
MSRIPFRWIVVGVFMLSSALNYLDRQILAAVAPTLKLEFGLNNADYGLILATFSITYAISSPVMGLFLDRFGLTRGISMAVALWSGAGIATAFVSSFAGLLTARAVLGVGEAAGIPSTGKLAQLYLKPKERSIGAALSQIGLSVGSIAAPWLVNLIAPHYGWRGAFFVAAALGFVWIPLWWLMDRHAEKLPEAAASSLSVGDMLRDKQMLGFIVANLCSMTVYTLWTNWTTVFLTTHYNLPQAEANQLAPLPHFFAYFGGLVGGMISYRLIARGMAPLPARRRALLICALMMTSTALAPLMPTPLLGALMASFSFFWASGWGVSLYTMPVDAYGARAAFGVSLLTMAYGILQVVVSPLFGGIIDKLGFGPVCLIAGLLPLVGYTIVHLTRHREAAPEAAPV